MRLKINELETIKKNLEREIASFKDESFREEQVHKTNVESVRKTLEESREREVKWHEKVLQCQFFRDTDGIVDRKKLWLWLNSRDLKKGTEALLMAAQEQAIRTNDVKHHIDKSRDSPTCRLCSEKGETMSHPYHMRM